MMWFFYHTKNVVLFLGLILELCFYDQTYHHRFTEFIKQSCVILSPFVSSSILPSGTITVSEFIKLFTAEPGRGVTAIDEHNPLPNLVGRGTGWKKNDPRFPFRTNFRPIATHDDDDDVIRRHSTSSNFFTFVCCAVNVAMEKSCRRVRTSGLKTAEFGR